MLKFIQGDAALAAALQQNMSGLLALSSTPVVQQWIKTAQASLSNPEGRKSFSTSASSLLQTFEALAASSDGVDVSALVAVRNKNYISPFAFACAHVMLSIKHEYVTSVHATRCTLGGRRLLP